MDAMLTRPEMTPANRSQACGTRMSARCMARGWRLNARMKACPACISGASVAVIVSASAGEHNGGFVTVRGPGRLRGGLSGRGA